MGHCISLKDMLYIGLMGAIDLIQLDFFPYNHAIATLKGLRRLYIGRGFTLHQLHALIMRVRHEVVLTNASMIVINGIMAMFLDEQIKRFEARSILRHCLALLQDVATSAQLLCSMASTSNIHHQLKQTMRPYLNHQVRATWEDKNTENSNFQVSMGTSHWI